MTNSRLNQSSSAGPLDLTANVSNELRLEANPVQDTNGQAEVPENCCVTVKREDPDIPSMQGSHTYGRTCRDTPEDSKISPRSFVESHDYSPSFYDASLTKYQSYREAITDVEMRYFSHQTAKARGAVPLNRISTKIPAQTLTPSSDYLKMEPAFPHTLDKFHGLTSQKRAPSNLSFVYYPRAQKRDLNSNVPVMPTYGTENCDVLFGHNSFNPYSLLQSTPFAFTRNSPVHSTDNSYLGHISPPLNSLVSKSFKETSVSQQRQFEKTKSESKHNSDRNPVKESSVVGGITKDEVYWERRRKNNEAAKRSRDARRAKEDEVAIRAAILEKENARLRCYFEVLKREYDRIKSQNE